MKNLIQVAGIIDQAEADMLISAGVDYLGFPLRLPVNKEDLSEDKAAEIIKTIKLPNKGVLITYLDRSDEIFSFCKKLGVNVVQLHGRIELAEVKKLKSISPSLEIIKSLVVHKNNFEDLVKTIEELSSFIDAFITDTFDPSTGASGATGKTHDWQISKMLVELSHKPVILAGGLNTQNVKQAIEIVKPAGVDVHTGVELPDGRKSKELVEKFIDEAKKAFSTS